MRDRPKSILLLRFPGLSSPCAIVCRRLFTSNLLGLGFRNVDSPTFRKIDAYDPYIFNVWVTTGKYRPVALQRFNEFRKAYRPTSVW